MKFGDVEFHIISDGHCWLDGGGMFGVIPKPMWEKKMPADARNRVKLAMNCLLVHAGGKRILVETGAGDKFGSKFREIYGLDGPFLIDGLRKHGLHPHDIDVVINTHLHFDHCGGNTKMQDGKAVATFRNARYVVQRGEFEHAQKPTERDRASYLMENYMPLLESGKLSLLENDRVIASGVELIRVPGHTANMQCVKLSGGGKTAFFFADLIPTTAHLGLPWIMGFDLYPMITLENKRKWIAEVIREGWLAIFGHDANIQAGYLREEDGRCEIDPVKVD